TTNQINTYEISKKGSHWRDARRRRHDGRVFRKGTNTNHWHARFTQRHNYHRRQTTPAARPEVRWRDQGYRARFQTVLAANGGATQGRTQRALDHDRRSGLRRLQHLWRCDPDAGHGSNREGGIALYAIPHDRALLPHARGPNHRPQPPLVWLWCDLRTG